VQVIMTTNDRGQPSSKSHIRLDPDASDVEREAQILDWLKEFLESPVDDQ